MSLSDVIEMLKVIFPPKPKFSADDVPDLSGKIMIVTGGNTGIGSLSTLP